MVDKDWYVDVGCGDFDGWVDDFFCFGCYFLFFFGVVIIKEYVDLWDDVEGDLFLEFFGFDFLIGDIYVFGLVLQFIYVVFVGV